MSKSKIQGLTSKEVKRRQEEYGFNEIPTKKDFTILRIIISQFTSYLIIILIIAGSISLFLHETIDGLAIFAIVIINSGIGFFQEYKAENAVKTLKKLVVQKTIVIRDGEEKEITIRELVPGDIVILSEGDKIPADMKLIEAFSIKADESMLTGESVPVYKNIKKKEDNKEGLLFKGTIMTTGRGKGEVIHTGIDTEFGKIVNLLSKQEKTKSPLSKQLDDLGKKVGAVILILIAILFILGYLRGISALEMLMVSVALGVSAIPEGMPIIVTLTLAMGVQVLAGKKAIVRKMNAIETLGATTIICSDKTGTLTLNEMTVKKINTNFKDVNIPGRGYKFKEHIKLKSPEEKKLLEICENANNSFVDKNILGDPTEIALKILTRKAKYIKIYEEIDEKVFTSDRKMMSSLHQIKDKKKEIMSKGAFETIIKKCDRILKDGKIKKITEADITKYTQINKEYAEKALRVLGFAYKPYRGKFDEKNLIFVGIVGMLDPPRKTVKKSIQIAEQAGIKIRIITGDNPITAKAIGEQIGLKTDKVVTGDQINNMTDKALTNALKEIKIFARTSPQHKYRIVDLLKKDHEVVAATGDGVNDAPAIKHANVGVAMGIKGTEATKEVADIVLKDDNFTTIVNTIKEGRRIYHNILAFIKYMLSANYDTITTVGILTILGFPLPIMPLQILWINVATDALPALALGNSPANPGIMEEAPHPKKENIFKKFAAFIMVSVVFQTILNLLIYFYGLNVDATAGIAPANLSIATHTRTLVFTEIVLFELFFAFVCKEEKSITIKSFLSNKSLIGAVIISFLLQLFVIYTPFMQTVFNTVPLTLTEWGILVLAACSAFFVPPTTNLLRKLFKK